jgi:hypothetical protein
MATAAAPVENQCRKEKGMAETIFGRAARPVYEVHELTRGETDLGLRYASDSLDTAVEFAFAYLDEHDPDRSGAVKGLEVLKAGESVWSYRHADVAEVDLVRKWGFDPTKHWHGPPAYSR